MPVIPGQVNKRICDCSCVIFKNNPHSKRLSQTVLRVNYQFKNPVGKMLLVTLALYVLLEL